MPGNEVEDRVHNFFGQENSSQGHHHSQTGHGNWPVLNSNLLVGNQRQIGASFISDSKNYNVQQSDDSERGGGSQSLRVQHGFNLTQSNVRSEFGRSLPQNQHTTLNGYVHGRQFVQTRQNEANLLGMDTEADRHNLTLQGISILESQRGSGPELTKKNPSRLEDTESPVNYDFLGGQQQMSGQQPGMLQSLPRQHSGINDMQVLQQQFMLTQMQELHRQQLEERQQSSINQVSPVPKQTAPNHSAALVNGIPINEAGNYPWPPELVSGNSNWLQRGASQVIQGSSSGLMLSPEQGQALRLMGLVPQQVDQSLYGVPISSVRSTPSQNSHDQLDKPAFHQVSSSGNSFSGHQYATFPGQASMHDETFASRQNFQAKNMFGPAAGQGLNTVPNLENLQQVNPQQRSASMQELNVRQELNGSSETSHEKTLVQVAPSQSVSSLDPAEQKILFGSDENLWDAFGRSTRAGNMLDGTDFFNGFPSVQSGSWSALMQSAVAETSSADLGLQEEWSGPTFGDTGPPTGNQQPLTINDSSKQPVWTDNSLQTASALSSRPFPLSDDANRPSTSNNYFKVPGVQQSGLKNLHQQGDRFQNNSSNRSIPQFQEEGSKWLDRNPLQKPLTEGSHIYGNFAQPSGVETSTKNISGSLAHPQIISSYNSVGQPYNRSNGWNFTESLSPDSGSTLKHHENEKSSQLTQSSDHKGAAHLGTGHGAGRWKATAAPNSSAASEHVKSGIGSLQVFREDSSSNSIAAIPNSSTLRANQERSQQLQNINNLDFWKDVQSSGNSKGNEDLGKYRHHLDENPQFLESPGNNGLDKGTVEMNEKENLNKKENSSDSSRSNMLHHTPTSGLRESVWLDASDSHNLIESKQKLSNQLNRKSGTRRFQYHPMGDVDIVEPSYGPKHIANSQAMSQQVSQGLRGHDQVYVGQSRFSDQADRNSMELEKVDTKGLDEIPLKSMLPGYVPNSSGPYDNSVGNYASNKTATSSQNMLELLHKVDQSNERGIGRHISSSNHCPSSEMPETETSDGPVSHFQRNQSSATQGFGLQLAPPSQRLPIPDRVLSSQSSSQTVLGSSHVASGTGDKANMWFALTASVQSLASSHESSQGEFRHNISDSSGQMPNKQSQYNVHGKFSTALMSGSPSHHQGQHTTVASGQLMLDQTGQSVLASAPDASTRTQHDLACSAELSQPNSSDQTHSRDPQSIPSSERMQVSLPSVTPGISQLTAFSKMVPNLWNSVKSQQHLLAAQPSKASSNLFKFHHQSDNNSGPLKLDNQDAQKGGDGKSGFITSSINSQGFAGKEQLLGKNPGQQMSAENNDPVENMLSLSQGRESVVNPLSDSPHSNAASTQRDIEAFGRSLRPNNAMHQNYSLLHQVQAMKTGEIDPSNHSAKRFKGPDSDRDVQHIAPKGGQPSYGYNNMVRDASCDHSLGPSGDSKMLSFSAKPGESQDTNASAQDMYAFVRDNHHNLSSSSSATAVRSENSQISPQMAPSWFEQYGSFKNGQTLPTYDVQKTATAKALEQPFIVGKPTDSLLACSSTDQVNAAPDASHLAYVHQSSYSTSVANEQPSSHHLLPPDVTDHSMITVRPKKRKSATSELIPWHKELTEGSQRLQNISVAELVWAQAVNRLIEKVEDEAEAVEDGPLILIPKRRLILTTQLMQQLLHPPPAGVISADSRSHYESIAYFIARSVLGYACGAISIPGNDAFMATDNRSLLSEKLTTFGSAHHRCLKVMEDFIGKARKLETDLLRLDNRTSILDLRVEYQDLERFSVINRFAKFHGRGQVDGPETSSSSDTTANSQKSCPQRYVTALPMPRNLPDRVQCLSL
ncbi:uncharacterized protein LOC122290409 isoform X1 [Carya illinoinensis]|uniref:uncharacterized protein LOC122290409 isoform X1 n=1 Tax=Carya illinoinensis TaxID=32201 RepID=UPI001C7198B6|nr:uncharacterized protein LOC122290409 isoform X1 [Carya illinoinensis]XP_042954001.1 uncharacterized protein LOC122290409 isoform X1 [Carya illinoinensis]XP_042954003.1 uncharacterized protein LOC122290409 isoform X1 [Carya illinoinensis]XP_042954004.1 uncharacterized protein LOC122290409 isoform X1 [Carya illinoinensis]XP_042954005.1 uncharacterized protein LOC122290409 isoform X1 [Carya illinoinensis]XP_042954006.1 uncharacterized protein LOC122290409 isoform X1 [Carya illinoinensis]